MSFHPNHPSKIQALRDPRELIPPLIRRQISAGLTSLESPFSPLARSYREEYHGKNSAIKTGKELVPDQSPRGSPSNTVSSPGRRPGSDLGTRSRQDAMVDLQPLCKRPRQATGDHSVAPPDALQDSAKESLKLPARIYSIH